jgi:two-component system, NarL family, response regulator DevR
VTDQVSQLERDPARRPMSGPARVVVAVQQRMVAEVVAHRLASEDDVDVVETLWGHEELITSVDRLRPDVVVLDLKLVDGEIAQFCRDIQQVHPQARLAILTGPAGDRHVMEAVESGCAAFAAMDKSDAELVTAVRAASKGSAHLHPELVAGLVQRLNRSQRRATDNLTARELEVLGLLASGLGNAALAERLGVSVNTVRHHVQSILNKLGVHTKLQAVTTAMREGLISPESL